MCWSVTGGVQCVLVCIRLSRVLVCNRWCTTRPVVLAVVKPLVPTLRTKCSVCATTEFGQWPASIPFTHISLNPANTYTHAHAHTLTHTREQPRGRARARARTHAHTHTHAQTHTHTRTHTHTYTRAQVYTQILARAHAYSHTRTYRLHMLACMHG